jgi:hypothetical protein
MVLRHSHYVPYGTFWMRTAKYGKIEGNSKHCLPLITAGLGFGLPKPIIILVTHLLLNIKKIIKVQIFFLCKINVTLCF